MSPLWRVGDTIIRSCCSVSHTSGLRRYAIFSSSRLSQESLHNSTSNNDDIVVQHAQLIQYQQFNEDHRDDGQRRRYCNDEQDNAGSSTSSSEWKRTVGIVATLGSPIIAIEGLKEQNPVTELVFLSGKSLGYFTEKIFENEAGQSIMLGLFLLSVGFTSIYFHGLTKRTVRKMQIYQATKFGQVGHPFYTSRVIPPNPLLKSNVKQASRLS